MTKHVIFDTDAGGDIDDLYALSLILKHPQLSLLGVTTVSADTQARARLIAKMLRLAGRRDIPVHAGIRLPAATAARGVEETAYKQYLTHLEIVEVGDPEYQQQYGNAVNFILDTLSQSREPITIIGTGPWTNIASVVQRATDEQKSRIASLALMGGEVHWLHPESNVLHDPEAAQYILQCGLPIFLATWSRSQLLKYSMEEVSRLIENSPSPYNLALEAATDMWWAAGVEHKPGPVCFDVIPVFWAAGEREQISCIQLESIPVELHGTLTRGMMLAHPWQLMKAKRTTTMSPEFITVTDSLEAGFLKNRFNQLVFNQ